MQDTKRKAFRPRVKASEYPPVPLLLEKSPKTYNVLVGEDAAQVRFVEQLLDKPCQFMEHLTDNELLAEDSSRLFRVEASRFVNLSPNLQAKVGFWSLEPIERGSAGANAIVRYAATILGIEKPDKTRIQRTADLLASEGIEDLRVAIWKAVWLLCGGTPEESKAWVHPWEDHIGWLRRDVDPAYRLHTLYKHLVGYALSRNDDEDTLRKAGVSLKPSKLKYFNRLNLDLTKVHDSIHVLSQWRNLQYDPYLAAFRISAIWKPSKT